MSNGAVLGSAYLQVIPKMSLNPLKRESAIAGDVSGESFNKSFSGGILGGIGKVASTTAKVLAGVFATKAVVDFGRASFDAYSNFEQLAGGVEKIFDEANISQIMKDAQGAYKDLNMSANEYLESINQVGASFAQTMGDQKGYDTARTGMKAIADYASGTGRNLDELNDKYAMITRATSSYQSIADQFSGILPATSADFLEQAQAAGYLKDSYKKLTDVPVAEYQEAVTQMLEKGVKEMGLAENTMNESLTTISGSLAMAKSAWENVLIAIGTGDSGQLASAAGNLVESFFGSINEETGKREGGVIANVTAFVQRAFSAVAGAIPGFASQALDALPDSISGPLEHIAENFSQMFGGIDLKGALGDAFANLVPIVTSAASGILNAISTVSDFITNNVLPLAKSVYDTISPVISGIFADVQSHLPQIQAMFDSAMGAIGSLMADIWPDIQETVLTVTSLIGSAIEAMWPIVKAGFEKIASVAQAVWPVVATIIRTAVGAIKSAVNGFQPMVAKVKSVFNSVKNAIMTPINAARDAVKGAIDRIKGIINGAHLSLPHFALPHFRINGGQLPWGIGGKGSPPSINVDWYARGGWVDEATIFGAGERGGEFVWPGYAPYLDRYADAIAARMPGGGGVTVNLTYNGSGDADELVSLLTRDLRMMRMTGAI